MDENNQQQNVNKEYLKKLAEKIKAEKARKEAMQQKQQKPVTPQPITSIHPTLLNNDEEEMASEKTAIIDLSLLSGAACDAKITIIDGKEFGKNIELSNKEIHAGRGLDNDLIISDLSVSRKHFKVTREDDHYVIEDLGSGNGIKLNGERVSSATLYDGDIIYVGARQLRFDILNAGMKEKFSSRNASNRTTKEVKVEPKKAEPKPEPKPEPKKAEPKPEPKKAEPKAEPKKAEPKPAPAPYVPEDIDEPEEPKGGSSKKIVIIVIILAVAAACAYLFLSKPAAQKSEPAPQTQDMSEDQIKSEITGLIKAKKLDEAGKLIEKRNNEINGDNPLKPWIQDQIRVIANERGNESRYQAAKSDMDRKNPAGAIDALKKIESGSVFYQDAQAMMASAQKMLGEAKKEEPKAEPKAEPKKEEPKAEPKAEPKKEEPKKAEPKAEHKKEEPKKAEPKAEPKKEEPKKAEPKAEPKKEEPKKAEPKPEPKKAEPKAEPKPEPKKAEPKKAEPKPNKKKASMSDDVAKQKYMEARTIKDEDPEKAKKLLQEVIDGTEPGSKHNDKAKKLLESL